MYPNRENRHTDLLVLSKIWLHTPSVRHWHHPSPDGSLEILFFSTPCTNWFSAGVLLTRLLLIRTLFGQAVEEETESLSDWVHIRSLMAAMDNVPMMGAISSCKWTCRYWRNEARSRFCDATSSQKKQMRILFRSGSLARVMESLAIASGESCAELSLWLHVLHPSLRIQIHGVDGMASLPLRVCIAPKNWFCIVVVSAARQRSELVKGCHLVAALAITQLDAHVQQEKNNHWYHRFHHQGAAKFQLRILGQRTSKNRDSIKLPRNSNSCSYVTNSPVVNHGGWTLFTESDMSLTLLGKSSAFTGKKTFLRADQ